ncbi:hypothetical protein NDU88_006392 [Pleurodeles waltl]|uniref:Uncharacterized protein n=1 Tax=Pleurodeles waltl TaxID=8319 RepID=A0AAV7NQ65_PLEWA|nr:hypothetical protein NDU88_006392 [Pleurodeles waltl]
MPSTSSNHNLPRLRGREARCLKGPLLLPELLVSRSAAVERKTADIEKQEGEDDGESRADSSGSSSGAEATVPSAEYIAEEEPKKPVVPSRDKGEAWQTQVRGVFGVKGLGRREEGCWKGLEEGFWKGREET